MSMRARSTLLIILIVLTTTAATFFSGLYFTISSTEKTMEQDLAFAIGVADSLVGTEMRLIKTEASAVARLLETAASDEELERVIREQFDAFAEISALAVFDRDGVIADYSEPEHRHDLSVHSKYFEMVYGGETIISSPFYCSEKGEFVMNVYTPLGAERILSMTIPGLTFSDMLSQHRLWQTGDMFMLNEEGTFIGAADQEIVLAMHSYIAGGAEPSGQDDEEVTRLIQQILSQDSGVERYLFDGTERLCAYSRIEGSVLGWYVAVTVPLTESPQADALKGQAYSAVIFAVLGVAAAFFLARVSARPFKRIEAQNRDLKRLNETIRSQAERLRDEHERIHLMLDATPLACRLWNRKVELIECNEASVKMFKLRDKQEYIDRYFELIPEYQPDGEVTHDKIRRSIIDAFQTGLCVYECIYRLADGTPVPAENTLVRVPYGDDYVVAAYSRDLREQKKMMAETLRLQEELETALQKARDANQAKSAFLASMSHEIRTPLNAVVGLSELALDQDELDGEMENKLEKIHTSGMTILSIVNDILDISKIESGKFEIYPVQYDTPSLINDTVALNIVRIGERAISFKLWVDERLPGNLYGDDLRVKQIFNNLLSNAFKYTNSGSVEWRISFEREGDTVWLVSSVRDTGIGIRPEDMQKLFSDYNQVDTRMNRRVEGTGLGLSITKRLVEMMDGVITAESEYGKGSVFSVRLRQQYVSDTPIGEEVAKNLMGLRYNLSKRDKNKQLARIDLSYARVLVVDDIMTNLDVAKGMMKPYGIHIDCVTGGRQAVELIRAGTPRYSAVFMDHMMPGMDGIEATRVIREELGTDYARGIPIIALTANAIIGNDEMFLSHGFQAFLSKPVDTRKLDAVLRAWVRDKELEKEAAQAAMPSDNAFLPEGIVIPGVDQRRALERFGGVEEAFIDVLRSYAGHTRQLIADLGGYLASGDLENYAITVHGIKGSSYGICAQEAGAAAEALEAAAKAGDAETVKAGHAAFEKDTLALLDGIDAALGQLGGVRSKPLAAEPAPALLREVRDACGAFDMDRVDQAMEQLEASRYERGGELVAWLREKIDQMNFEEISSGDWLPGDK